MTNITLLQVAVAVLLMGYPLLLLRFRAAARRAAAELIGRFESQVQVVKNQAESEATVAAASADKLLADTIARLEAEAKETFMRGTQLLSEECAGLKIEVERAREVADDERARTARYLAKISDFERERTIWQNSYHEQSIGHGNAQQLMMSTIEALARQLQAKGVRPQIPPVIHAVRAEFEANHEMPSRAAMEAIRAVEAAKDAATVPTVAE